MAHLVYLQLWVGQGIRQKAEALGKSIREEDGIASAIAIIEMKYPTSLQARNAVKWIHYSSLTSAVGQYTSLHNFSK